MKTLGVKFQVAGVKEAQASLDSLRKNLNTSLQQNKQAVKTAVRLNKTTRVELESSNPDDFVDNYQRTVAAIRNKQYAQAADIYARPRINRVVGGYFEGIGNAAGSRTFERLDNLFRKLTGKEEYRESVDLSQKSIDRIGESVAVALTGKTRKIVTQRDKNAGVKPQAFLKQETLVDKAVSSALMPLKTIQYSFYEGIGSFFGEQFASGLSETLEEELNFSQKRKGRIVGKTIGFIADDGTENLGEKFDTLKEAISDLANNTDRLDLTKIRKAVSALLGIPTSIADSYLTGFRRSSIEEEAIRQVDKNKATFNEDISDIKAKKKAIITASGFAGEEGKQGRKQAERLRELNQDENTTILSSDTPYTDVMIKPTDALSGAAWGLNALANAASINLKGFNPDALEMVNKVLKLREENPDIDINLVGHSAGGFVVEEAQYLLELLKIKGTTATTIGTPNLKGGLKPKNIKRIFGENDPLAKLHSAAEIIDFVDNNYQKDSISKGHFFDQYLESPEVRKAIFNRQKHDNSGTEVSNPHIDESVGAKVASVVGDAIITALETQGDLGVKAEAFSGVIIKAATEFSNTIKDAGINLLNNIKSAGNESLKDITVNDIPGQIDKLSKQIVKVLAEGVDRAIINYRREVLKSVAAPQAKARAKEILRENKSKSGAGVSDRDKVMFVAVSGHHGREGMGGALVAKVLRQKTANRSNSKVIWIKNSDNDVPADSFSDLEAYSQAQGLSFAKPRIRGYSKDAVEGAAQALAARTKNPDIEIKIVGFSAGTDVADEIIELLNILGVKNVSGIGMGGTPVTGAFNADNYQYHISPHDPVYDKAKQYSQYGLTTIDIDSHAVEGVLGHDFNEYVRSDAASAFIDPGKFNAKTSIGKAKKFRNRTDEYLEGMLFGNRIPDLARLEKDKKVLERRSANASPESAQIMREAIANIDSVIAEFSNETTNLISTEVKRVGRELENIARTDYRSADLNAPKQQLESIKANLGNSPIDATVGKKIDDLLNTIKKLVETNRNKHNISRQQLTNYLRLSRSSFTPEQIAERRNEYQVLNTEEKRKYFSTIQGTLNSRVNDYRTAIRNNNLVLAKEIATSLLKQIGLVKQVYQDIVQNLPEGDELKNIIRGNQGYLTSVQTEIIQGQPNQVNQGRIGVGLPDIFEQQLRLEDEGGDVVEGFIEGITAELASVSHAGRNIIEATAEGVREEGEIQSPSKLFERLGRFIVEGFRQGIIQITEAGEELEQRGRDVVAQAVEGMADEAEDINDEISDAIEPASTGFGQFFSNILEQYPLLNKFKGVIGAIAGLFLGGLGINAIISILSRLSGQALETAMAFESLDRAIVFVSRNQFEGMDNLNFISEEAKRLTVDLTEAKQAYAGLIGAAKNTPLEGEQTKRLFSAFAAAAANRGIDAQSQGRLFTALEQIIGKRQFSAEEVKGQIGDIRGFGDFQGILAEAMGISTAELGQKMSQGEVGLDVMPKVVALIEAQNAAATGAQTAQQAQTQYNNSLLEFKNALGQLLQPLEKLKLNILSGGLDLISKKLGLIFKLITITGGVTLLSMFGQINLVNAATVIWTKSINLLTLALKKLWASKFAILGGLGKLLAAYALVTAAYLAWSNVLNLTKNQYQDLEDGADSMTAGIDRYREAIEAATSAQNNFNSSQNSLELKEGLKLPEWLQGIAGQERLNLDIVRKGLDWVYDRPGGKFLKYGPAALFMKDKFGRGNFTTEAERRDADRRIATGEISFQTGQLLTQSQPAVLAAEEINKFDAQIREIQAKRLELLPGDTKALEASLEKERVINKERDKQLKILTTYQQELQNAIALAKAVLLLPDISDEERERAQQDLQDTEDALSQMNNIVSAVTKQLSEFQRQLRNSNERINNFIERRGLQAQSERADIITKGVESGEGDRVIQLKLETASRRELDDYVSELEKTIDEGRKRLESGALAEGYKLVKESAEENGLTLDTDTIKRLLTEERDQAQKDVLEQLLAIRENKTKLYQYREQLAQNLQANRNSLIDFNRTISDYFFNLNQQLKEAQLEVLRVINQIVQTNIRNKLQSALSPNAESFVNGLISSTQSMLDQVASYAERVLGQRSARIQFAGQKRTLQLELQDFARNIGNANDALAVFEERLRGSEKPAPALNNRPAESLGFAQKTKDIANRLGIDPHALMTIMLFESAGTLSPKVQGANVPGQGRGRGLIQFMPATARGLGTSDAELAGMTDIEQLDWVEKYFAQFKGNFGAGKLENLYAAVLAGNPLKVNASDGYVTARIGAQKMMEQYGDRARQLLDGSKNSRLSVPFAPNSSSGFLPPPPQAEAEALTNQVIDKQQQKLDLNDELLKLEGEALKQAIAQNIKADRLKIDNQIVDTQFALSKLLDVGKDMAGQYDFQTAPSQSAKNVRDVNNAFSDRGLEISRQIVKYTEEINAINDFLTLAPKQIRLFRESGKNDEADLLTEKVSQARLLLKPYQEHLAGLVTEYQNNTKQADTALKYVVEQNKLKEHQENLNKRSLLLTQQVTLAEQRGTVEAQRQVRAHQEDLRLYLRINELRQQYAPGEYLDSLIAGEERQSQVNQDNINYDAQIQELEVERKLLEQQQAIGDKKAGFLNRYGFQFKASKIQRDNAIELENNRFEQELIDLQKKYKDQPELLEQIARNATELNRVNLDSIEQEFKSLGTAIEDAFISSTQGFFTNITTGLFDGTADRERQILEERLRYAEQINQLEAQYSDYNQAGELAHLKNRARELNEQKLDKIKNEFNIFKRAIDFAGQALIEFTKQLAAMAAQYAAAKFIGSLVGGIGGSFGGGVSAVGNDYGSGAGYSAFVADEGATVGGRKVGDRTTNYLRRTFPGIAKAWSSEGEGAQLGVFHTGEELLSRKTGEAGRYQLLKRELGINPLSKILNYSNGGTIPDVGNNILSGFSSVRPRIDLSVLGEGRRQETGGRRTTVNLSTTVISPNADSFRANQDQMNQDLIERLRRGI